MSVGVVKLFGVARGFSVSHVWRTSFNVANVLSCKRANASFFRLCVVRLGTHDAAGALHAVTHGARFTYDRTHTLHTAREELVSSTRRAPRHHVATRTSPHRCEPRRHATNRARPASTAIPEQTHAHSRPRQSPHPPQPSRTARIPGRQSPHPPQPSRTARITGVRAHLETAR